MDISHTYKKPRQIPYESSEAMFVVCFLHFSTSKHLKLESYLSFTFFCINLPL